MAPLAANERTRLGAFATERDVNPRPMIPSCSPAGCEARREARGEERRGCAETWGRFVMLKNAPRAVGPSSGPMRTVSSYSWKLVTCFSLPVM